MTESTGKEEFIGLMGCDDNIAAHIRGLSDAAFLKLCKKVNPSKHKIVRFEGKYKPVVCMGDFVGNRIYEYLDLLEGPMQ